MQRQIFRVILLIAVLCQAVALYGQKRLTHPKSQPIDIVYTWVDDRDPEWQKLRRTTADRYRRSTANDANVHSRFRNRDELKYSLRSVYRFAKFINHIYIVTCNQTPKWLKPHKMITVIDHQEIFKNKAHLPTFNSQAIEANLQNIPQLSEYFIYLNDDVLFGSPVKKEDFFTPDGKIKVVRSLCWAPAGKVSPQDIAWVCSWKNSNAFLNAQFRKEPRYALQHAPFALRKSFMQKLERSLAHIWGKVSSHQFRSPRDFVITNGLVQYVAWYHAMAEFIPLEAFRTSTVYFGDNLDQNYKALEALRAGRYAAFCIEDLSSVDDKDNDFLLQDFFETYFSEPAPWERSLQEMGGGAEKGGMRMAYAG